MDDGDLLRAYAEECREEAFGEVVARYAGMVFATCHRVLGDEHAAEDASQATFLLLSRKAKSLTRKPSLAGWLYRTAELTARNARRQRDRRRRREKEAAMNANARESDWNSVSPVLDSAIAGLPAAQRDALVMRYLQGLSETEACKALGVKRSTLGMRLARGLEAVRKKLKRRGIAVASVGLAAMLQQTAQAAAPAGLAHTITATCLSKAAAPVAVTKMMEGTMNALFWIKAKAVGAAFAVAAIAGTPIVVTSLPAQEPPAVEEADAEPIAAQPAGRPSRNDSEELDTFLWAMDLRADPLRDVALLIRRKSPFVLHVPSGLYNKRVSYQAGGKPIRHLVETLAQEYDLTMHCEGRDIYLWRQADEKRLRETAKRLQSDDPFVRMEAISALADSGDMRACALILPLTLDSDGAVREWARRMLARDDVFLPFAPDIEAPLEKLAGALKHPPGNWSQEEIDDTVGLIVAAGGSQAVGPRVETFIKNKIVGPKYLRPHMYRKIGDNPDIAKRILAMLQKTDPKDKNRTGRLLNVLSANTDPAMGKQILAYARKHNHAGAYLAAARILQGKTDSAAAKDFIACAKENGSREAFQAAATAAPEQTVALVVSMCEQESEQLRNALIGISRHAFSDPKLTARLLPALRKLLNHKDKGMQFHAVFGLWACEGDEATSLLLKGLKSDNTGMTIESLNGLRYRRSPTIAEAFADLARNPGTRNNILTRMIGPACFQRDPKLLAVLLSIPGIRKEQLCREMIALGEKKRVAALVKDKEADRIAAAKALALCGSREDRAALLAHKDPEVRIAAAESLPLYSEIPPLFDDPFAPASREILAKELQRETDANARRALVRALADPKTPSGLAYIVRHYKKDADLLKAALVYGNAFDASLFQRVPEKYIPVFRDLIVAALRDEPEKNEVNSDAQAREYMQQRRNGQAGGPGALTPTHTFQRALDALVFSQDDDCLEAFVLEGIASPRHAVRKQTVQRLRMHRDKFEHLRESLAKALNARIKRGLPDRQQALEALRTLDPKNKHNGEKVPVF